MLDLVLRCAAGVVDSRVFINFKSATAAQLRVLVEQALEDASYLSCLLWQTIAS